MFVCDVEKEMTGEIEHPLSQCIAAVDNGPIRFDDNKRSKHYNVENKHTSRREWARAHLSTN